MQGSATFVFGKHVIPAAHCFLTSSLSYAFVNISPVIVGHVLVSPKRLVPRVAQLRPDELADLFGTAQRVGRCVERAFGATSLTFAVQDGQQAGQSVFHVHVHVLPRRGGDFPRNDEVYHRLEEGGEEKRTLRSAQAMSEEAAMLRELVNEDQVLERCADLLRDVREESALKGDENVRQLCAQLWQTRFDGPPLTPEERLAKKMRAMLSAADSEADVVAMAKKAFDQAAVFGPEQSQRVLALLSE